MKKTISILLSLMLMASLLTTVFAAGTQTGSITINNASSTATYEIYKLLDLESYDATAKVYSYKANAAWTTFVNSAEASAYLSTEGGYVTWIAAEDDATVAAFAKKALAYAEANDIAPVKSSKNEGEFVDNKFSNLELGYYLVDSTVGVLCGLTTTNPDASIDEKNGIPTIEKTVQEDSNSQWGDTNTADIGQTVAYRVTINVEKGTQNYVLHDVMDAGLTFNGVDKVEIVNGNQTTETALYDVKIEDNTADNDCTFEVSFDETVLSGLGEDAQIIVSYTATLNENAVIAGAGNKNLAYLTFGESEKSNEDTVTTYTYAFDIVKTDSADKLIDGAEFRIYDAAEGGNEIKVVATADGYRVAKDGEEGVAIVVTNGKVRVSGLDSDTYYLEETVAPAGYNKLSARQSFTISNANLDATFENDVYTADTGVQVVNKTGSEMPETGGIGTILFITFGLLVVLGTGVILVTKKRMSMIED